MLPINGLREVTTLHPISDNSIARHLPLRGAIFDFNGTLSEDEPLLYEIYASLFSEKLSYELTRSDYFENLAGLSDPEIISRALSRCGLSDHEELERSLLSQKISRYCDEVLNTPRIYPRNVAFVEAIAKAVPIALVTGAARAEVHAALRAAGIFDYFKAIITTEDVEHGKPDPEGFLTAARILAPLMKRSATTSVEESIVVFEDSSFGVEATERAGMLPVVVGDPAPLYAVGRLAIPSLSMASYETISKLFIRTNPARPEVAQ